MNELSIPALMAIFGLIGGGVMGFTARTARFCTFSAIEDARLCGDWLRVRAWGLAIVVAIVCTYCLNYFQIIDITQSVHLRTELTWLSLIVGGLCFGFGMAQVGTCPFGALVRIGTGDLRALVIVIVIGVTGYMTMNGITASARVELLDRFQQVLPERGDQSLPSLLGATDPTATLLVALALALGLFVWVIKSREFRVSGINILAGCFIGLTIAGGWVVTGYVGNDEFDPQALMSFGFISSISNGLVYLMTYSGAVINFPIAATGGVVVGSLIGSCLKKEFKLEAFDDAREMRRYLIGATMMGVGGITALGCTVGQGITGLSTLSIGSVIAMASIGGGAVLGLHYLLEDTVKDTFSAFFRLR